MGPSQWWSGLRWGHANPSNPDAGTALILSGGGARAAYQVGVLMAVANLLPRGAPNPFPVICGTSAGALNATALAVNAHHFRFAVRALERVWRNLTPSQVYRTDFRAFITSILRWALPAYLTASTPVRSALLDNRPLCKLLSVVFDFDRIQQSLDAGHLRALSITASSYGTGESVAFFQALEEVQEWQRARRRGQRSRIGLEHLLASSAIPILFPAQKVGGRYFGDGAVRQLAPISPALHLGAQRVLVVGVAEARPGGPDDRGAQYPSMAQVLGHVMNSVFVDTLEVDLERLQRINSTLEVMTPAQRSRAGIGLRPVEVLHIAPSASIDGLAAEYAHRLPRTLRALLRGPGGGGAGASALSYLLFDPEFCKALMDLGYKDAMARSDELREFLAPALEEVSRRVAACAPQNGPQSRWRNR